MKTVTLLTIFAEPKSSVVVGYMVPMPSVRLPIVGGRKSPFIIAANCKTGRRPEIYSRSLTPSSGSHLTCAVPENAKCARFFSPRRDGLKQFWRGVCWCNPPYGRDIGLWIEKASQAAELGATVVMLLPVRTDTAWWHDFIQDKAEVRFIRGRLKFGDSENSAPFPSVIVVFRASDP